MDNRLNQVSLTPMAELHPYRDCHRKLFADYFNRALPYPLYTSSGEKKHAQKWEEFRQQISLSEKDREIVAGFKRQLLVLVMSGIWCGDCARQGPILHTVAESCPLIQLRFIDNRENPKLQDELRINGAEKVPVVVAFSEDMFELARFGDRHLSVYREKLLTELGPACDSGLVVSTTTDKLALEITAWVEWFERLQIMLRLSPALRRRYGD